MAQNFFQRLVELERKVSEQERRNRNRRRTGTVSEIDLDKGLARVKFSDKPKEYKSGWIPWQEIAAGGTTTHIPLIVGEQVDVVSESGDLTDAVIEMSTHSNQNPRPHNGAEMVIKRKNGSVKITVADDKITIDGNELVITAPTKVTITSPLTKIVGNVKVTGRLHTVDGIYDEKGVFSETGVYPPNAVTILPVPG